jgi:small subunit ribosomal protein S1
MTLFDETNANYSDSNTTTLTEQQPATEGLTEQSTVEASPAESSATEQTSQEEPKPAAADDFASALESFTTETEEAQGEDHVLKGTVVKLTGTHVVVDIGAKSEGMVPIAEVLDHAGQPKFKAGDEIDVMREKGEAEEGYINLSFQKAQKLRAWDEIEKAFSENRPIHATIVERTKGGVMVDILGARAFLPGSQIELRPVRNLDGLKGQSFDVAIVKLNKKRGNIVVSRKQLLEAEQNEKRSKVMEHLK